MNTKRLHPVLRELYNVGGFLVVKNIINSVIFGGKAVSISNLLYDMGVLELRKLGLDWDKLFFYIYESGMLYVDNNDGNGYVITKKACLNLFDPKILRITKSKKPLDPSGFENSFIIRILYGNTFERHRVLCCVELSEGTPNVSFMGDVIASFTCGEWTRVVYLNADNNYLLYKKRVGDGPVILRVNKMCNHSIIVSKIFDFYSHDFYDSGFVSLIADLCNSLIDHNIKLAHVLHQRIEKERGIKNDQ